MPGSVPRCGRVLLGLPTLKPLRPRRATAVILALLTLAPFVGVPHRVLAQPERLTELQHISVTPDCGPQATGEVAQQITITVRGYGFTPLATVALAWQGGPIPFPGDQVAVSDFGTFEATVTVPQDRGTTTYEVAAFYAGAVIGESTPAARASFTVPCLPQISVTPDCSAPGVPISVQVTGSRFLADLQFVARISDGTTDHVVTQPATLDPNAVLIDMQFIPPVAGVYYVVVGQVPPPGVEFFPPSATAAFVAPCPTLTVTPTCSDAGGPDARYSIVLSGAGFVPSAGLEFYFDPAGVNHRFYRDLGVSETGGWGPVEIQPYMRGPATYEILVRQLVGNGVPHATRAFFTVPCAVPVVTLDPTCAPPQLLGDQPRSFALTVRGTGFQPGAPVTVIFDPQLVSGPGYSPETAQGFAAADGSFSAPLTVAARPAGTYNIGVQQVVDATVVDVPAPQFIVPCTLPDPRVSARPDCGDEAAGVSQAYSIRVTGRRFIPGFVEIIFDATGTPEAFPGFAIGDNGRFDVTIAPSGRPAGSYRIVARQQDALRTLAEVNFDFFTVPCSTTPAPVLTINPPATAPGLVVQVRGTGFPAGSTVALRWDFGIDAGRPIEVSVLPDGTFDRQVVLFAHDFTGPREMTAGTPADPQAFPDVRAELLVSPGQGTPSGFTIFDSGATGVPPIVIRR